MLNNFGEANRIHNGQEATSQSQPQLQPYPSYPSQPPPNVPGPLPHPALPALSSRSYSTPAHLDEYFNCMFQPKIFSGQRNASSNFKRNPSNDYSFEKRSPYAVCYKSCCQPSPYSMNATATPSALQFSFGHPNQQSNPESIGLQDQMIPNQSHQQSQQMDFHYLPSPSNTIFNQRVSNPNSHETPSGIGSHYTSSNYLHPSFYNPRPPNFLPEYYERTPSKNQSPKSTIKQQTSVIKNSNDFPYASEINQKSLPPPNYIFSKRPESFLPSYLPPCSQPNFPPSNQYSTHRNPIIDNPIPAPPYRNFNYSVPAATPTTPVVEPKSQPEAPKKSSSKPPLDVRQFLETWDDDDDEPGVASGESPTPVISSSNKSSQLSANLDQRNSISDLNASRGEYPVITPDPENSVLFKILKPGGGAERGPIDTPFANLEHYPYNRVQLGISSSPIEPPNNPSVAPLQSYPRAFDRTPPNYAPSIFQLDSMTYGANEKCNKPDYHNAKVVVPAEKMCNSPCPISSPSDLNQIRRVTSSPKKTYLNLEHNVIKNNDLYSQSNQLKSAGRSRPSTPSLDYDFRDPEQFIKPTIINKADYQRKDQSEDSILKHAPKSDSKKGKNVKERNVSVVPPNNAVQRNSNVQRSDKALKPPNPAPYTEAMTQFHRNQIPYNKTTLMPYCMPPGNPLPNTGYDYPVMSVINNSHNYVKYDNRPSYASEEPKYDNTCSVNINLNITSDKSPQVFLNSVSTPSPNHPPHSSPNDSSRLLPQSSPTKCITANSDMHTNLHKKEKQKSIPQKSCSENNAPSNLTVVRSHGTSSTNFVPRSVPESIPEAFQIHSLIGPHKSNDHADFINSSNNSAIRDLNLMTESVPIHQVDSSQKWNKVADLTSVRSPYVSSFNLPAHCPPKIDKSDSAANSSHPMETSNQSCLFQPLAIGNTDKRTDGNSTHFVGNEILKKSCTTESADKSQTFADDRPKANANNSLTSEVFDTQYYKSCIYDSSSSKNNSNQAQVVDNSNEIAQCLVSRPNLDINSNSIGVKHKTTLSNDPSRISPQALERLPSAGVDFQKEAGENNSVKTAVLNDTSNSAICSNENTVITSTLRASLVQTLQGSSEKQPGATSNNIENLAVREIFPVEENKSPPKSLSGRKNVSSSAEELFVDEETIDSIINERCDSFGAVEFPIESSSQTNDQGDASDRIPPLSLLPFPESEQAAPIRVNSNVSAPDGTAVDPSSDATSKKAKVVSGMADLLNSDSDLSELEDETVKTRRNKKRRPASNDYSSFDLFSDNGTFFSDARHKPGSSKNDKISEGNDCYGLTGTVSQSLQGAEGRKTDELTLSKSDNHTDFEMLVQNEMNKFNFESDILNNIGSLDVEVEPPQFFSEHSSTSEPKSICQSVNDNANKTSNVNSDLNVSTAITSIRSKMDDLLQEKILETGRLEELDGTKRNSSLFCEEMPPSKLKKEETDLKDKNQKKKKKSKKEKKEKKKSDSKKKKPAQVTDPDQNSTLPIKKLSLEETRLVKADQTMKEQKIDKLLSQVNEPHNTQENKWERVDLESSHEKSNTYKSFKPVIRNIDSLLENDIFEPEPPVTTQAPVIMSDYMKTGTHPEVESHLQAKSNASSNFTIECSSDDHKNCEAESTLHQKHSKKKKKKKKKEKREKEDFLKQSFGPTVEKKIDLKNPASRNESSKIKTVTRSKAQDYDDSKFETPKLSTSTAPSIVSADSVRSKSSNLSLDLKLIVSAADYIENQSSQSASNLETPETGSTKSQLSNSPPIVHEKKVEISVSPPSDDDSNSSFDCKIDRKLLESIKFPVSKFEHRKSRNSLSQSSVDSVISSASNLFHESYADQPESRVIISSKISSKICSRRYRSNLSESSTASSVISTSFQDKITIEDDCQNSSKLRASRYSSNDDEFIGLSPTISNNLSQDEENQDEALEANNKFLSENGPFFFRKDTASSTPRQILSPIKTKSDIDTFSDAESLNDERRIEPINFNNSLNSGPTPFFDQISRRNNTSPVLGDTVYEHTETSISCNQDLQDSLSEENLDQEVEDCLKEVTSIRSKIHNPPGNLLDLKPNQRTASIADDAEVFEINSENTSKSDSNKETSENNEVIEALPENSPTQKLTQIEQYSSPASEEIICHDSPSINSLAQNSLPCPKDPFSPPHFDDIISVNGQQAPSPSNIEAVAPRKLYAECSPTAINLIKQLPACSVVLSVKPISMTVNSDISSNKASLITNPLSSKTEESCPKVSHMQSSTNTSFIIDSQMHCSENKIQEVNEALSLKNTVSNESAQDLTQQKENSSGSSFCLVSEHNFCDQSPSQTDFDEGEISPPSAEMVISTVCPEINCPPQKRETQLKDSTAKPVPENTASTETCLPPRSPQNMGVYPEKSYAEVDPSPSPQNMIVHSEESNADYVSTTSQSSQNCDPLLIESNTEYNSTTGRISQEEEPNSMKVHVDSNISTETSAQSQPNPEESGYELLTADTNSIKSPTDNFAPHEEIILTKESSTQILREVTTMPSLQSNESQPKATESSSNYIDSNDCSTAHLSLENCSLDDKEPHEELSHGAICPINNLLSSPTLKSEGSLKERTVEVLAEDSSLTDISVGFQFSEARPVTNQLSEDTTVVDEPPCKPLQESSVESCSPLNEQIAEHPCGNAHTLNANQSHEVSSHSFPRLSIHSESGQISTCSADNQPTSEKTVSVLSVFEWFDTISRKPRPKTSLPFLSKSDPLRNNEEKYLSKKNDSSTFNFLHSSSGSDSNPVGKVKRAYQAFEPCMSSKNLSFNEVETLIASSEENENSKIKIDPIPFESKSSNLTLSPEDGDTVCQELTACGEASEIEISSRNEHTPIVDESTPIATETQALFPETFFGDKEASCKIINQTVKFQKADSHTVLFDGTRREQEKDKNKLGMSSEKTDRKQSTKIRFLDSSAEVGKKLLKENLNESEEIIKHDKSSKDCSMTNTPPKENFPTHNQHNQKVTIEEPSRNVRNSHSDYLESNEKKDVLDETKESCKELKTESSVKPITCVPEKEKSASRKKSEGTKRSKHRSNEEDESRKKKKESEDNDIPRPKLKSSEGEYLDAKRESLPPLLIPENKKHEVVNRIENSSRNEPRKETEKHSRKKDKSFSDLKSGSGSFTEIKCKENKGNSDISSKEKIEPSDIKSHQKYDTERSRHRKKYSDTPSKSTQNCSSSLSKSRIVGDETKSSGRSKVGTTSNSKLENSHHSKSHDRKSKKDHTDQSLSRSKRPKDETKHCDKRKNMTDHQVDRGKSSSSNKQSKVVSGKNEDKIKSTSKSTTEDNIKICNSNFKSGSNVINLKEDSVGSREVNTESVSSIIGQATADTRNDVTLKNGGIERGGKPTNKIILHTKPADSNPEKKAHVSSSSDHSSPAALDKNLSKKGKESQEKLSKPKVDLNPGREKPLNCEKATEIPNKMKSHDTEVPRTRHENFPKIEVKRSEGESRHKIEAYCPVRNWECPFVSKDNVRQMKIRATTHADSWSYMESSRIDAKSMNIESTPSNEISSQDPIVPNVSNCSENYSNRYSSREKIAKSNISENTLDQTLVNPLKRWKKPQTSLESYRSQTSKILTNFSCSSLKHSENPLEITSNFELELDQISAFVDSAPKTPESEFVGTPKTPDSSFGRIPKTPESNISGTSKTPEINFNETPKTPEIIFEKAPPSPESSFGKIPKTPEIIFEKAPKTPENIFERAATPENSLKRTSKSPESNFSETPKTPESILEDIAITPEIGSDEVCKTPGRNFDSSSEILEDSFTKTPKTPDSSFGRAPKTPKISFEGTPKTPESNFDRAPETPGRSFSRTLKTPERRYDFGSSTTEKICSKSLKAPASSSAKTPKTLESSFGRAVETSECNYAETPKTPECCFGRCTDVDGKVSDPGKKFTESQAAEADLHRTEKWKSRQSEVKKETEQNASRNEKVMQNNDTAKKKKHKGEGYESEKHDEKSGHRSRKDSARKVNKDDEADTKKLKSKSRRSNQLENQSSSLKSSSSRSKSKSRSSDLQNVHAERSKTTEVDKDSPSRKNQPSQIALDEEVPKVKNSVSNKMKPSTSDSTAVNEPVSFTSDFELDFDKHEIDFDNFHKLFDQTWEKFSKLKESSKKNKANPKSDVRSKMKETEIEKPSQSHSATKTSSFDDKNRSSHKSSSSTDKENAKSKINLPERKQNDVAEKPSQQLKSMNNMKEVNSEVDDNLKLLTNVFGTNKTKYKQSGSQYQTNRYEAPPKPATKMNPTLVKDHPIYYAENYKILDISKIPLPPDDGNFLENLSPKNPCNDDTNVINIKLLAMVGNQLPERFDKDSIYTEKVRSVKESVIPSLNSQEMLIPRQVSSLNSVDTKFLGPVIPKAIVPVGKDQPCPSSQNEREMFPSVTSSPVSKARDKEALYSSLYKKMKHKRLLEKNRLSLEKELSIAAQDRPSVPNLNPLQSDTNICKSGDLRPREVPDSSELKTQDHEDKSEAFTSPGMIPLPAEPKELSNDEDSGSNSDAGRENNKHSSKEDEIELPIESTLVCEPPSSESQVNVSQTDENKPHHAPLQSETGRCENIINITCKALSDQKDMNESSETVLPLSKLDSSEQQQNLVFKAYEEEEEEEEKSDVCSSESRKNPSIDSSKLIAAHNTEGPTETALNESDHLDSFKNPISNSLVEPVFECEQVCMPEGTKSSKECLMNEEAQLEFVKSKLLKWKDTSSKKSVSAGSLSSIKKILQKDRKKHMKSSKRKKNKVQLRSPHSDPDKSPKIFKTHPDETSYLPRFVSQNVSSVSKSVKSIEEKPNTSTLDTVKNSSSVTEPYELEEGELEELDTETQLSTCPTLSRDSSDKILSLEIKASSPQLKISEETSVDQPEIDSEISMVSAELESNSLQTASFSNFIDKNEENDLLSDRGKNSLELKEKASVCETSIESFGVTDFTGIDEQGSGRDRQDSDSVEIKNFQQMQRILENVCSEEDDQTRLEMQKSMTAYAKVNAILSNATDLICEDTETPGQSRNPPSSKLKPPDEFLVQSFSNDGESESNVDDLFLSQNHSLTLNLESTDNDSCILNGTKIVSPTLMHSIVSEPPLGTAEEPNALITAEQKGTTVSTHCNESMADDCESVVTEHTKLQAGIVSESDEGKILLDSFCDEQTAFNWDFDEFDTYPGESASEVPTADLATAENTLHLSEKCISCEPPTRLYLAESEIETSRKSNSPQKVNESSSVCTQNECSTKTSDELLSGKSTMASNAESIQETEPCRNYTYEDNLAEIYPKVASPTDEPSNQMLIETDNSADSNLETATFSNEILQSSDLSNIEDLASTNSPATIDFIQESSSTSQLCENERGIVEDYSNSEVDNLKETKCIQKILKTCPKEDNNTENLDQSPNRSIQKNSPFLETGFPNDILTEKNYPQAYDINQETLSDSKACEDDHVRTLSSEHRNNSLPVTEPTQVIEPVSQILTSNSHCTELEVKMGALDLTQKMVSSSEENLSYSPKESLVESESKIININHTENFSQITVNGLEKPVSPTLPEKSANDVETSSHLSENSSGENDVNFDIGSGMASNGMSDVLERVEMTSKSFGRSPTVDCQVEDGNVCDSAKTSGLILSDAVLHHDPLNLNVEMEVVIGSSGDENEQREPIKSHDSENEVSPIKTSHAEGEDSKAAHKIPSPSRKRRKRLTNSSSRKDSKKKRFTSPKNIAQKEQCASAGIFLSPELTSEKIQTTVNSEEKIEAVEDGGGRKNNFDDERLMNTGNEIVSSENIEMTERKILPKISSAEMIEEVFLNDEPKDSVHLKESASVTGNGSYEKMDEVEHFLEPTEGDNSLCTNRRLSKKCKSVELLTRNVFSPETGSNKSSRSMSYLRLKSTDSDSSVSPNYLKGLEHDSSNSFMKCFSFIKDSMPFMTDSTACLTDSDVGSPSLAKEIGTDINEGVCLPPAGSDMDESITAALCDSQLRCFDECPINNTFSYEGKGNLANPEMELIGSEEAEDDENMEIQTCNSKSESDLKVRLPWNRIFNLKKRRRKNITSSKGIELGPAKIEIRLNSSENSGSWKVIQNSSVSVSSGSNCSLGSPIGIKVNRLVLQRHPTNDAESSIIGEVGIPKIKDSKPETIPKVIIKKNGTKRYKSFFKISSKQLPVVKILRDRHIDLMALKLKEMVDDSPPSVRAEQSPLQPTAIRQWTGPKSRRPGFNTATSSEAASKLSAADTTESNRKATNVKVKKLPKLLREMQLDDPPEVDYSRPICLSTRRKVGEKNKGLEMSKTPAREKISLATIREESDVELINAGNTPDNFPGNVTLKYFPSSMGEPCDKDGAPRKEILHQSSKRRKVDINVPNDSPEKDSNVKSSLISFESIESQNFENDVVEGVAKTEPAKKKGRSISFDSDHKGVYQRSRSSCQVCCAAVEETNENSNMTNNLFHCTKCCLEFKSQEEEKAHDIAFHKNTAGLQSCCLCHVSFVSEFSFKQHLKSRLHQLLESVQKETINSLFKHFTGNVCPQLEHSPTHEVQDSVNRLTPLQIVLESETACGKVDKY